MSTQKSKIKNPKLAKRRIESLLAETIICKACGWEIEFLSGGYESYTSKELLYIIKNIYKIYKKKLWLNIGVLKESELKLFKPYIVGVTGAVECINPTLHLELCPSKPITEIEKMFKLCDKLNLKKSITLIIGLGESLNDFPLLQAFIKTHKIDRITFYALNPHQETIFKKGPETSYYLKWIGRTRKTFPRLEIIAGSWVNRLKEIHHLLNAGADTITKFPSIKLFNTKFAKQIEAECKKANRKFNGTMTLLPEINIDKEVSCLGPALQQNVKAKLTHYLQKMT